MVPNFTSLISPMVVLGTIENDVTQVVVDLLIQLAVILFVAKLAGELARRIIKVPPVLAELAAGVVIGPHAAGALVFFGQGPLFPIPERAGEVATIPVSDPLFALAQIGSIVLLFAVGLETNLRQFLRYAGPALTVAVGGVVLPFALGVGVTVFFGFDGPDGIWSPEALFMGAIMMATSVGITARVLADMNFLGSPEGVTIIAAAVIDDVLGILVLTIVVGISANDGISVGNVSWVGFKAIAFWLGLTGGGILLAPYIFSGLSRFKSPGAMLVLALALAILAAGLAEVFGLAFIIGAFSVGLALSITDLAKHIEESLEAIVQVLVPVFFVVMGMLVDIGSMQDAIGFGLVVSALAVIGKVVGSGGPALGSGFNLRGSARIGVGMMPRGEVALIIAGIGLSKQVIEQDLFGVAIMMTIITTVIAPVLLVPLIRNGDSGLRQPVRQDAAVHDK
jgi:Kef-type K+ transport system membrane component KefB